MKAVPHESGTCQSPRCVWTRRPRTRVAALARRLRPLVRRLGDRLCTPDEVDCWGPGGWWVGRISWASGDANCARGSSFLLAPGIRARCGLPLECLVHQGLNLAGFVCAATLE